MQFYAAPPTEPGNDSCRRAPVRTDIRMLRSEVASTRPRRGLPAARQGTA